MNFQTREFVLEFAYFETVRVHILLVAISRVIDLVDDHHGVAVDKESFDAEGNCQA